MENLIEHELKRSVLLRAFYDILPIGVIIIDREFSIYAANRAVETLFDRRVSELSGKRLGAGIGCLHAHQSRKECGAGIHCADCALRRIAETAFVEDHPVYDLHTTLVLLRGGIPHWTDVLINCVPLQHGAHRYGVLTILDTTAEGNKERELLLNMERFAMIGVNAAHILHDLKNPLTAIDGFAQLLEAHAANPKDRKQLASIRRGAANIHNKVQEITAIASGQGAPGMRMRAVSFAPFMRDILDRQHISHRLDAVLDCTCAVMVDPEKMETVIWNLVTNADEALSQKRNGVIVITDSMHDGAVTLSIKDNGPGIAARIRDRLFQPGQTSGKSNGRGFGLYGSKKIVEEHGGSLTFATTEGIGTTFSLLLPVADHDTAQTIPKTRQRSLHDA